jgi:hypothetical protein
MLAAFLAACSPPEPSTSAAAPQYLYLWTASADTTQPDFLAVLDVTEDSARYGRLVRTLPVPGRFNVPHHTEHELPADRHLFANGFATGQSFIFDLSTPDTPLLFGQFGDVEGYRHPHSYVRLPNGNVLATFQMQHAGASTVPCGLVELTPAGQFVRAASANTPGVDPELRVYSASVVAPIDRVVTTTTDMNVDTKASRLVQVWRLSDLALQHTIPLPAGPAGEEMLSAEPRVLGDGRTVLVSTFSCGLYLMEGLEARRQRLGSSRPFRGNQTPTVPFRWSPGGTTW